MKNKWTIIIKNKVNITSLEQEVTLIENRIDSLEPEVNIKGERND